MRESLMHESIEIRSVIEPQYIQRFSKSVQFGFIFFRLMIDGCCDRTGRIFFMTDPDQFLCDFRPLFQDLIRDLISDAPQYDTWVVAITSDHIPQILFVAGIELIMIVPGTLSYLPHIKGFIHNKKPHFIAQIQKLRIGGIVSHAQGIAPQSFDFFQPPCHDLLMEGRPENPQIMVHTKPAEPVGGTVKRHSLVRVKSHLPESIGESYFILPGFHGHFIQCRIFRTPEIDLFQRQFRAALSYKFSIAANFEK